MRILFVWSAAEFSTFDVARGYRNALVRQGHEVFDFRLYNRLKYHGLALKNDPTNPALQTDLALVMRLAAEGIVVEALRFKVDLVVTVCGMGLHPDGLELLNRAGFPSAIYFTECPYDDENHAKYAKHVGHVACNDSFTARKYGWLYLAQAYDPEFHHPVESVAKHRCDVLIVGTGWKERQDLLEGIDWSGIDLRIRGHWMGITRKSPLWRFYKEDSIDNGSIAERYCSAKVCINQHRFHPEAESLNPRAYELAACGALQVSDERPELSEVFGATIPTYHDSASLESHLRRLLALPESSRLEIVAAQRDRLLAGHHTFDDRAARLMAEITGGVDDGPHSRSKRAALPARVGQRGAGHVQRLGILP